VLDQDSGVSDTFLSLDPRTLAWEVVALPTTVSNTVTDGPNRVELAKPQRRIESTCSPGMRAAQPTARIQFVQG
jgi:hypothetical protein